MNAGAELNRSIADLLAKVARKVASLRSEGKLERAQRLSFGADAVRAALDEAGSAEDRQFPYRLMLGLRLALNSEHTLQTEYRVHNDGADVIDDALTSTVTHLTSAAGRGQKLAPIRRSLLDDIVVASLDAAREWAGRARMRGEGDNAALALSGVAYAEEAIRRARGAKGDYRARLLAELTAELAAWEAREDDEDGYGSASLNQVMRAVRNAAVAGVADE